MKIGIVTFWWSEDNYGQLLQCYALQEYLRKAGHDPFLIRYDKRKDFPTSSMCEKCLKALNPIKLYRHIVFKVKNRIVEKEYATYNRQFEDFRKKYITQTDTIYSSYEELKNNPPIADVYVVGSDQVWNYKDYHPRGLKNILKAYMLDFVPVGKKRISYAASWGMESIHPELHDEISLLLKKFSYISVREESGVEICKKCGVKAEWVVDPTLLLNKESYRNLYENNEIRKPKNKYLFLYMLNNECVFDKATVYSFAKANGLDVVYVTGNGVLDKNEKLYATIPEWLYLIDNAEYVVTNSFHCCVFSVLFYKKFANINLSGKHAYMNCRFESLYSLFSLDSRTITDKDYSNLKKGYEVDYTKINKSFLLNCISHEC